MDLFVKKTAAELLHEAENEGGRGLKRVLGPGGLIALGVGVIIGAGLFSVRALWQANIQVQPLSLALH